MPRVISRTFADAQGEILPLPPKVAFGEGVELTLVRSGDVLTVYPSRPSIRALVAELEALPRPSTIEMRDEEPLPERG